MAVKDVLASRAALRNELRKELLERFEANYRVGTVDGTSAEIPAGLRVLTRKDVSEIVEGLFTEPLPAPSDHHAEVSTPATVTVSALCPECNLPNLVAVTLTSELLVDDDGKELRVKAKTKGRVHVCGQLELPDEKVNGQMSLEEAPGTAAKFRYDIDYAAAKPDDVGHEQWTNSGGCEAAVETPEGGLACFRAAGHEDDLHWDSGRGHAWRMRLDIEGATVEQLDALLLLVCTQGSGIAMPSVTTIESWDQATRDEVAAWASAVHLIASDHDDVIEPPLPSVLERRQVEPEDSELLPGGPVVPITDAPSAVLDTHASAGAVDVGLQCVSNNHVPGCEHMGGKVPPKRGSQK